MRNSKTHAALAALIPLSLLLTPCGSVGQVTIKERVEIGDESLKKTSVNEIVAPFDGWVKITYVAAYQYGSELAGSETLFLSRGSDTLGYETYPDTRLDAASTFPGSCAGSSGQNYVQYANLSNDIWYATQVEEDDAFVMSAFNGVGGTYEPQLDTTAVWDVTFTKMTSPCKYLVVGVEIVRDTLNLSFDPPADSTIYPSPGLVVDVTATVRGADDTGTVVFEIVNHDYPDTPYPDTLVYFLDGPDTTLTIDPVQVEEDTARAKLVVMEYWGVVDVTAKYVVSVPSKNMIDVVIHEKTERWHEDEDEDGIPDDWEEANGNRSMLNQLATCVSPSAECTELDIIWDSESSPFATDSLGDGITKLREYKGAMTGSTHMRLSPEDREVFIDQLNNPHATWAIGEARTQLGLVVIEVDGLKYDTDSTVVAGDTALFWPGGLPDSEPYHYVLIEGVTYGDPALDPDPDTTMTFWQKNHYYKGQVIVNGIYQWNRMSITHPDCLKSANCTYLTNRLITGHQAYGWTISDESDRFRKAQTFLGSAENIWNQTGNTIPENAGSQAGYSADGHWFQFGAADSAALIMRYSNFPISSSSTLMNPFDLLGVGHPKVLGFSNDQRGDGKVMGMTLDEFQKRNTLHELGHALGMYRGLSSHPTQGGSVMRQGIGPAKTASFEVDDKKLLLPK